MLGRMPNNICWIDIPADVAAWVKHHAPPSSFGAFDASAGDGCRLAVEITSGADRPTVDRAGQCC
jgi:hypothetical protein